VVQFVHTNVRKNSRQAYAVAYASGEQTSAMSWGTGRAVARIPRVAGSGTSRSGQGAFGNMCRKGRMYAPTKIWRRWHRHVNVGQRRFAIVSALAASAVPALVQARGHRIDGVEEVPLVVSTELAKAVAKTKDATAVLIALGAYADVQRVVDSKKVRAGRGKGRNRRFTQRLGPLVVYGSEDSEQTPRAFRNIPGVSAAHVDRLNLLQLAPGGHLGRFIIWTQSAFSRLEALFGQVGGGSIKNRFTLPRAPVANADLSRLINSAEIQAVVRPALLGKTRHARQKKNPLKNFKAMFKLNPYALTVRKAEAAAKAGKAKTGGTRKSRERRVASKAQYAAITATEFAPVK